MMLISSTVTAKGSNKEGSGAIIVGLKRPKRCEEEVLEVAHSQFVSDSLSADASATQLFLGQFSSGFQPQKLHKGKLNLEATA